jgi:hypothetical protein
VEVAKVALDEGKVVVDVVVSEGVAVTVEENVEVELVEALTVAVTMLAPEPTLIKSNATKKIEKFIIFCIRTSFLMYSYNKVYVC